MIAKILLQMTAFFLCTFTLNASSIYFSDPDVTKEDLEFSLVPNNHLLDLTNEKYSFWFRDCTKQHLEEQHFFLLNKLLASGQTPFQSYAFIDTNAYGKILFIDGEVQSTQEDEFIYHESLIHPAMIAHPNPKSVLIIGAGEGAAAREVLRHPSVEQLVLVDIDGEIIKKSKELLREWHQGSFDHPKVELLIMDGKAYVESKVKNFDVIVIDICDKLDNGPAVQLYSNEFYCSLKEILNSNGIVVIQAMEFDPKVSKDHLIVHHTLKQVFPHTFSYGVYIPSFWAMWGFVLASNTPHLRNLTTEKINSILQERGLNDQLKHYDGETHCHMFSLSKELRKLLENSGNEDSNL